MTVGARARWLLGLALFLGITLACASSYYPVEVAPYRLAGSPYWMCSTSTPLPTATPQPQPPDWPPTPTPTPWGWPTATPTPQFWPGGTPTPTPTPVWEAPNWPPTPYPTPTPYIRTGEFYQGQNVWLPARPFAPATPGAPLETSLVRLQVLYSAALGASPSRPGHQCWAFTVLVENRGVAPLDIALPAQLFLKLPGDTTLYPAARADFVDFGLPYPETRLPPDAALTTQTPICAPVSALPADARLGFLAAPYGSSVGSVGQGANAPAGADAVLYFDAWQPDPFCAHPDGSAHPELAAPPPGFAFPTLPGGGRISGALPVTIPPCLYITRGFGCSEFATGVSGAGRCPVEKPYWHTGIDFSCYTGTPVYSPLGGRIDHFGWHERGYGYLAAVSNGPLRSLYAHLSAFGQEPLCSGVGNTCEAGYLIGYIGSTGFSTGPHLHWEVRVAGVPVDPLLYFGGAGSQAPRARPAGLALLARVASTETLYPLTVQLRDGQGTPLAGPRVYLTDIEDQPAASCALAAGQCLVTLPTGVYSLRLEGALFDGAPVHPYGAANVAAQQQSEYLHGPLAIWHTGPGTTLGLVLQTEADGAWHPYLDAAPEAPVPQLLNPLQALEPSSPASAPISAPEAPPSTLAPVTETETPATGLSLTVCWGALSLVVLGAALGSALRRRREGGRHAAAHR